MRKRKRLSDAEGVLSDYYARKGDAPTSAPAVARMRVEPTPETLDEARKSTAQGLKKGREQRIGFPNMEDSTPPMHQDRTREKSREPPTTQTAAENLQSTMS